MEILVKGLPSTYEVEHLVRLFYPGAALRQSGSTKGVLVYACAGEKHIAAALRTSQGQVQVSRTPIPQGVPVKTALCRLVYDLLRKVTGLRPPWGMLTGVRPVRLYRNTFAAGGEAAVQRRLQGTYDVSSEKLALLQSVYALQSETLAGNTPQSFSLYISIPFCPTRCSYCSFVSRTIEREQHLVAPYLQKLTEELAGIAQIAKTQKLKLETIYIGGGTPTALNEQELETLLKAVATHFDTSAVREYTVEAGRPDCTTRAKLRLLKQYGVGRISINPQTLSDEVLAVIGRRHSAQNVLECFAAAREEGHNNINMDLIAGLPKDTLHSFTQTLERVLTLKPENITVHTLTLKRASNIVIDAPRQGHSIASPPAQMLAAAYPALQTAGYAPYYLYRQKNTVENLENTGWARPGTQGLYNIYIMEEAHTILAAGAGASTKLVGQGGAKIQRIYNHKYPADYINQFDQLEQRKEGVERFYASYLDTETPG